MARSLIARIELSVLAHATEDGSKVVKAVQTLLPLDCVDQVSFSKRELRGEFGNPIVFYRAEINEPELTQAVLRTVSSNLSALEKESLLQEFEQHLRKGNLYLRIDKQAALRGKLRTCRTDPIHLRVRFRTSNPEEIREICQKIGILPS